MDELACLKAVIDADPIRYLDLTQPLARGTGQVVDADAQGALVRVGDLDSLLQGVHKVQLVPGSPAADNAFDHLHPLRVQRQGLLWVLTLRGSREETQKALEGFRPVFLEFLPLSLEEVFILEMEDQGYAK